MNKQKNIFYESVSLDMTRRCNMKCPHCAKGDSQNEDISKEIIDKALDELANNPIATFCLFGGEPFLNPEMVCYTLDQVIARKFTVAQIRIFTNGTIQNKEIRNALNRAAAYMSSYLGKSKDIESPYVFLTISENAHQISKSAEQETMNFYKSNSVPGFVCELESEFAQESGYDPAAYQFIIEGNAEKNYKELISNPIRFGYVRVRNDRYDFVREPQITKGSGERHLDYIVDKTISISTNGNVYIGRSASWENVDDTGRICNIMDCQGDLFDKIDSYCWRYPIKKGMRDLREKEESLKWCREHGYTVADLEPTTEKFLHSAVSLSRTQEYTATSLHYQFPYIPREIVYMLATIRTIYLRLDSGTPGDEMMLFIQRCIDDGYM